MARLAQGSAPWIAMPLLVAFVSLFWWMLYQTALALLPAALALLVALFFLQFFRDPERTPSAGVCSAADGKVVRIDRVTDPDLGEVDRLSIFMSPVDVHVNRFPMDGKVVWVRHFPGGHIPAWDKDSERNERVATVLDTDVGRIKVIQIAGTLARRIVPYVEAGHAATKGERLGLIRLGSRCDLLVPPGSLKWTVTMGQQVHAGSTQVAEVAT